MQLSPVNMGLRENMRDPRWTSSSGGFRGRVDVTLLLLLLLLLLLGLSSSQIVPPQKACSAVVGPQNLPQSHYQDMELKDTGGVGFMKALVQSFLNTVQSKPFPEDLILKLVKDYERMISNEEVIKEVLLYEVGFLVCAAIGVLYIILMPIVGFFLACCRSCDNCGGKMYQKQTSSTHCRRRALYWSAFVTTVIILAGNICMFRSNEALKVSVDQSPVELRSTIQNINNFLTTVPQQIDFVVNESYKTVEEVTKNLNDIGSQLGEKIQEGFKVPLDLAQDSVTLLDQEIIDVSDQLEKLNTSLTQVLSSTESLQASTTAVKNGLSQTLSKPNCMNCNSLQPELQKITLDTSITIPGLGEFESAVAEAAKSDLKSSIDVQEYFDKIPETVTNETKDVVQSSIEELGNIKTQISQVTSEIPLSTLTENVSQFLNQAQTEIDNVQPQIERAEHIRWGVCVAVCCVVLLVVVCNFLGLVLGPLGLTPRGDPSKRSCTADCGGTFLMMGAWFSFLFSWLFMIAVLILFLLGGNVYTLVCRPWSNGQLLKFIDTPDLIPGLEIGPTLGLESNISISDIYRDCEKNQTLWTTLHLNEVVNLEELLNVSKYTKDIQTQFENTAIDMPSVTFLSADVEKQLSNIQTEAGNFDPTITIQQMNNLAATNMNTTAEKLEVLAAAQTDDEIRTELQNKARDLRQIQANIETTIIPQLKNLNSTIESLQSIIEKLSGAVGKVRNNVKVAQDFLETNTVQIVKNESRNFLDCQLDYFNAYADWAKHKITQQVGRCGPVAGAVDSAEVILCAYMVESLNAFWFSLGWCMIFFIPSIIFSVKLAKYYRRMKYSDVSDNNIIMNPIPRAQMKSI